MIKGFWSGENLYMLYAIFDILNAKWEKMQSNFESVFVIEIPEWN